MKKNRLKELLDAGEASICTCMVTTSPQIVEVIGHSGAFDYIELFGEYACWSLTDLENFARAVELFPHMSSMMKVEQEPRVFITTRALDAGIQNVLFADCRSVEEVKECIRAVMPATPEDGGVHGCSLRRSVGYVLEPGSEAWAKTQRDVVIAIMIEKASAMEQLEEILSIKRVDMLTSGILPLSFEGEGRKLNLSVSAYIRLLIKQWSDGIKFEKRGDIEGGVRAKNY